MTDDNKALVAKLREKPSYWHQPTYEFLHRDAADAIEKLEAENSYLRGEREHGAWDTLKAKWKAAEQERDAYAAALDRIREHLNPDPNGVPLKDLYAVRDIVSAHTPALTLAARDRRVAAEALRTAAASVPRMSPPHDVTLWLRNRANQIESP